MCVYMHPPNGASAAPLLYQESYIIEPVNHTELKHEGTKKLTFSQALNKKVNKLDSFLKESCAFSSRDKNFTLNLSDLSPPFLVLWCFSIKYMFTVYN